MGAVVYVQQAAGTPFLDTVARVARDELDNDGERRLRVTPNGAVERASQCQYAAELREAQSLGVSASIGDLNEGLAGCSRLIREKRFDADHSFIANGYRLHRHCVRRRHSHDTDAAVWKIDMPDAFAVLIEWLFTA
jgi:hypothetical protein